MKWLVFKSPRKPMDRAIKELDYEPNEIIMQSLAMRFGNILVFSEQDLEKELKK